MNGGVQLTKISVIFPVFNVEYYLEEALDSLVNQSIFEDIEVIIVDDESSDNSRFIINKYAIDYDNIHIIRERNSGVSAARNYGMEFAKGEYVHFMDSDDFMLYDSCEKLYDFAKNGDYDIVLGNFLKFNGEKTWKTLIGEYVYKNIDKAIEDIRLEDCSELAWDMFVWNKIYKREFLEKNDIKFADELVSQDNIFSIEVLEKASKIGILPNFVYCWRQREKGDSVTQTKSLKRARDLIQVYHLVNDFVKENISDEDVLAKKYLKWQVLDIKYFIELIQSVPEENRESLCESIYEIYNLIPEEFREDLNTSDTAFYKMLNNKDWENLFLYVSKNYKTNPILPENLKEEYVELINFKEDAKCEELDTYASNIRQDGEKIVIDFKNYIPYLEKSDDEEVSVRIVNSNEDVIIDNTYIEKDRFSIPISVIPLGESILITAFKSQGIEKEYYIKTNSRRAYSYDGEDVEIARGKTSYLRLIKREKDNSDYIINEVNFKDEEYIEFKGKSNNHIENILINDYLDFYKFKYEIDYENIGLNEYEFKLKIPYKDLLKVPVKKWDVYVDGEFNKINLNENYEFINEKYRIYIKNYGNRFVIELIRYDPLETISKLNSDKKKLMEEKDQLRKDKEQLTEDKNKLIEEKNQLNSYKEKLAKDKKRLEKEKNQLTKDKENLTKDRNQLTEEKKRLIEKNKNLKGKIEEYKNRKDVKTVDTIKKVIKR